MLNYAMNGDRKRDSFNTVDNVPKNTEVPPTNSVAGSVRSNILQSGILVGNFDMLINFIEKHCQECPKFANDFEQLNREMTQKTMANLQDCLASPT